MSAVLKPYMPRRNSLAGRVVEFFQRNPDEELTRKDVADKFGFTLHAVDTGLQAAVDAGLLCKAKSADSTVVWCCGLRGKTNTPRLDSQHVLKAEAARPDATDRETPAPASPRVGAMGAGQAADAAAVEISPRLKHSWHMPKASSAAAAARTELPVPTDVARALRAAGAQARAVDDDETLVGGFAPQFVPAAPAERRMTLSLEVTMHEAEMIFSVLRCAGRVA